MSLHPSPSFSEVLPAYGVAPTTPLRHSNDSSSNSFVLQQHEGSAMKPSYPLTGTTVLPATNRDLSEKVSAIVIAFPVKHVADCANRTPEAAKKWRAGDACPDSPSLINMAREIPAIKWLIYQEIEAGNPEDIYSPRLVVAAFSMLQKIADGGGEFAQEAQKILSGGGA